MEELQGRLRRGRGAAARHASGTRGASALVYDCVCSDPRWDRQHEERVLFYARLMVDLEMPVGPVVDHLFDPADQSDPDPWRTRLAIEVLAGLVTLSRREAALPLRRYAAEGVNGADALFAMVELDDLTLLEGVDAAALDRCDDEDLDALAGAGGAAFRVWARAHRRLASALRDRAVPRAAGQAMPGGRGRGGRGRDLSGLAEAELVAAARGPAAGACPAILELGRRRSLAVLDLTEECLCDGAPERDLGGPLGRAVRDLGVLALPRARRWAASRGRCAGIGADVLAIHGDASDVPLLLAAFTHAVDGGNWSAAIDPAKGLGRLRAAAAVPALRRAWEETPYSGLRPRLLKALTQIAPSAAEPYAIEALWDCESGARAVAAGTAPFCGDARTRLRRLSTEPAEAADVRAAAGQRLRSITQRDS